MSVWPVDYLFSEFHIIVYLIYLSSRKTTRASGSSAFTLPLTPGMALSQISRLPVATLKLCLDHYHLPHGGNKQAVAKRLHKHLATAEDVNSDSSAESDNNSESDNTTMEDETDSGSSPATEDDEQSNTAPFTRAQQQVLEDTVRSLMRRGSM